MIKINKFVYEERAQMMTIEAFLGALLIVAAILFVVSQAPSSIQQSNPHSNTQLYHFGEDVITLLQTNTSPDPDFDNQMQYYIGLKKFDELDSYIENVLPKNIGYNIEMHDGRRSIPIIQNDYPTQESITINKMVAIKLAPMSGIGALSPPWYFENRTFGNGSLIIPMDKNQSNNITAYNLIMKISSELRIPVYQLMQDPRYDDENNNYYDYWKYPLDDLSLDVTVDPWNASSGLDLQQYAGGPYVIDAADLDQSMRSQIKYWAENPIDVPSSKIDKIEFDSEITDSVNITFTMGDSSTRTINLSRSGSNIDLIKNSYDNSTGNHSEFLDIDNTSISFADGVAKDTIIGLVMFNTGPYNITISNLTIDSLPTLENITIEGTDYPGPSVVVVDYKIAHNDPADQVTVNRAGVEFSYDYVTWLTSAPRIAVYQKAGTMMNYYSDSGISFEVLNSGDILNGKLKNYDFLFMPHLIVSSPMSENETINIIDWVSSGGVLLAECYGINQIEFAMKTHNPYNHTWDGFIGVDNGSLNTNVFQFIGRNDLEINDGDYYLNLTENKGAFLHPLAQSYTKDGTLPLTNGSIASFKLANNFSVNNSIMAVPQGTGADSLDYKNIIYIEAPFEKGTVIYLAGHDQSLYSQQRERLIFNSMFYSTTAKVYQYGLTEIQITMWYK